MGSKAERKNQFTIFVITFILFITAVMPTTYVWAEGESSPSLNYSSVSLKVGETQRLEVQNRPDGEDVVWSSSNNNVVSVVAGTVTAVRVGTATITATIGQQSLSCDVTVSWSTPGGIKAQTAGITAINVTWNPVAGAAGYKVYRASSASGTYGHIATIQGTKFTDVNRTTGNTYFYKVKAYKNDESPYSQIASAKAAPVAPGARTSSGGLKIYLKWNRVSGASGYKVYRATSKNGTYKAIKTIKSSKTVSFTDKYYKAGAVRYYKVVAYRTVGDKRVYGATSSIISGQAGRTKLKYNKKHNFYYKKKMKVKAYSYTGGGRTATGTRARVGEIAVDPRVIKMKSKVYVNGYGYAKAEDTGGNIKGKTIDVYLKSGKACRKWGVKKPTIYIGVVKVKK